GEATKELFLDSDSSNSYDNCRIWDISHAENARFGLGRMKGVINGTSYPKEKYATYLLSKRYHLLGTFQAFSALVNHVMIKVTGYGNLHTYYLIRGDRTVEETINGTDRLGEGLEFYTKQTNAGIELYVYNNLSTEYEANMYFESFRSFYPAPNTYYASVDGAEKITNKNTYDPYAMNIGELTDIS